MSQSEARSWWADVQHVRESIERRRAADVDDAPRSRRRAEAYAARVEDSDWLREMAEPSRRFDRDDDVLAAEATGGDGAAAASERGEHRRTVEINGRNVRPPAFGEVVLGSRRRPARRPIDRLGGRPDRVALWAVALAVFLILVAATSSSQAATPDDPLAIPAAVVVIAH